MRLAAGKIQPFRPTIFVSMSTRQASCNSVRFQFPTADVSRTTLLRGHSSLPGILIVRELGNDGISEDAVSSMQRKGWTYYGPFLLVPGEEVHKEQAS